MGEHRHDWHLVRHGRRRSRKTRGARPGTVVCLTRGCDALGGPNPVTGALASPHNPTTIGDVLALLGSGVRR